MRESKRNTTVSDLASPRAVRHAATMNRLCVLACQAASALLIACLAAAAPATNAPPAFQLPSGFRLETAATEPLVCDPVAMAFDARGRLFVAEHRDFPGPDPGPPYLGRVRLLEDTDGDGRFDTGRDFVDDLPAPSALICWDQGVIVAAGLEIWHCKDTDGDGHADEQRVLIPGPTNAADRADSPLAIRSFAWGLDNRIHAAVCRKNSGFHPSDADGPGASAPIGFDFAFDPRTGTVAMGSTFGSSGLTFDASGRKYLCGAKHPVQQLMWAPYELGARNDYVLPPPLADLTGPAAATPLFALREIYVPATSAARRGRMHRVIEHFSDARSVLVYRGNAFPPAYRGNVFVADARANLIHRFVLRRGGPEFIAARPADEAGTEFLATTNAWVRPLQLTEGPDGALYILDLHREFLDTPATLPAAARLEAARRRGNDRGRIYRVVPARFQPPPAPRLAGAALHELVTNLAHLNGWHRDTAARLLYERHEAAAVPLLTNMLNRAQSPFARLHALAVLDGLGALTDNLIIRALQDGEEPVRLHAVRLARKRTLTGDPLSGPLGRALRPLTGDASASVRYELALTLAGSTQPESIGRLLDILRRNPDNPWIQAAVLYALAPDPANAFELAAREARLRNPAGEMFLGELARLIGNRHERAEVMAVWTAWSRLPEGPLAFAVLRHLDEGLRQTGRDLAGVVSLDQLRPVLHHAALVAEDPFANRLWREEAIRLLGAAPFREMGDFLLALINPTEPAEVQLAAVQTLAGFPEERIGPGLVQRWSGLPDRVRAAALDVLLSRPSHASALLAAVQSGRIARDELSTVQQSFLRRHPVEFVARRANAIFGSGTENNSNAALKRLRPAVEASGQSRRGRQIYQARCQQCHRFRGEGFAYGPDLESVGTRGKEWVLTHLVDPNRRVAPGKMAVAVETVHLGSVLGWVEHETPAGLHLAQPYGGRITLPRAAIGMVIPLEVSAMPENLEAGLSREAIADLLTWLSSPQR